MKKINNYIIYLFALLLILIWFFLPIKYLIHFTSDDTYFYLKTALNFSKGLGSSFDGLNSTNGYHPLWFLIVSFVFFLAYRFEQFEPETLLRIIFSLTAIINIISVFLIDKIFRQFNFTNYTLSLTVYLLMLIPFSLFYIIGIEVQLLILLYLVMLCIFKCGISNKKGFIYLVGILSGLLFLTRIDLGFFIALVFLFYCKDKFYYKMFIYTFLILLFFISTYGIVNKIFFDTFSSISSYYKFSFDVKNNLKFFPTPYSNPIDFSMLIMFLLSGIIYFIYKAINSKTYPDTIKTFELSYIVSFIYLLIHFLFNRQGVREWYYAFPLFIAFSLLIIVFDRKGLLKVIIYPLILVFMSYFTLFRMDYYNHDSAYEFSKKVKEIVNDRDIIYQIDYSGLISFFSERKIVNGDGLINSFTYYKILKEGSLLDYLRELNPDYFILYSFNINRMKIKYEFLSFDRYVFEFSPDMIILRYPLVYGGIFRKKIGNFYLIKSKNYF